MPKIHACRLPDSSLLQTYAAQGNYTDCYAVDVDHGVSQVDFVYAFYTTWLFKLERWMLAWAVKRPSSDGQAIELASAARDEFAAWHVEVRTHDQLLMCDFVRRTRSWLMTAADPDRGHCTRLYFGSAVVRRVASDASAASPGVVHGTLMGFHMLYSRLLLGAACSRLRRLANSS